MRITHQTLNRTYLKRIENNLTNYTKSSDKLNSQRAFNKSHENVSSASKALKSRKMIADNERYQTAVKEAQGRADMAEDGLRTVTGLMTVAKEKLVQGLNGTYSESDRDKIATELEKLQEEVLQIMNSTYNNNYVYNSAGNLDGSAPFTVQNGALYYNGTAVDSMTKAPNGTILDGNNDPIQYNSTHYVDIGYGYTLTMGGQVDANTAFKNSYSGVESFGYGTSSNGSPLNAYSLFGEMVENLRSNNMAGVETNLNAIGESMEYMLTTITEIGARSTTLENTLARLESEYIILVEDNDSLEAIDIAEEIIYNASYEMSYMVTLQMGSQVLPQSIFDFLR